MSSSFRPFFTSDDIAMLERVLKRAGLHDCADPIKQGRRLSATRFLIAMFQRGNASEGELDAALVARVESHEPPSVNVVSDVAPIVSDRSNHVASSTGHGSGYRFGQRVAADGRWTIYHVSTGVPAQYGTCEMVKLDVKSASRALKILNSPATAA